MVEAADPFQVEVVEVAHHRVVKESFVQKAAVVEGVAAEEALEEVLWSFLVTVVEANEHHHQLQ